MRKLLRVTVFGSSSPAPGSPAYAAAYRIGRAVARHGLELVNGGYSGTMAAAAEGARAAGGRVIGVTVSTFTYARPNPYLSREIRARDLFARLTRLIALGDIYAVLPGSTGTLVELSLVWELLNKGAAAKPILIDACWLGLRDLLPADAEKGIVVPASSPAPARDGFRLFFCEDLPGSLDLFLSGITPVVRDAPRGASG